LQFLLSTVGSVSGVVSGTFQEPVDRCRGIDDLGIVRLIA